MSLKIEIMLAVSKTLGTKLFSGSSQGHLSFCILGTTQVRMLVNDANRTVDIEIPSPIRYNECAIAEVRTRLDYLFRRSDPAALEGDEFRLWCATAREVAKVTLVLREVVAASMVPQALGQLCLIEVPPAEQPNVPDSSAIERFLEKAFARAIHTANRKRSRIRDGGLEPGVMLLNPRRSHRRRFRD